MTNPNPWRDDPTIATQQRALVDEQLQAKPWPVHFTAFADAVRATGCPGTILEAGCGVGHGREILDRVGVDYASYAGDDISPAALALASERYPESTWDRHSASGKFDTVIDGCSLMHVEDWRGYLGRLCASSRRWLILHRVPLAWPNTGSSSRFDSRQYRKTSRTKTLGYGHEFSAWEFDPGDIMAEVESHGFMPVESRGADGDSFTLTYAKPRHFATYADGAYLTRLKALHASMVRHCGPFVLHVLAWSDEVHEWSAATPGVRSRFAGGWLDKHPGLRLSELPGPRRTAVEHMFTVGPRWVSDIMSETGEPVSYIDADLFAFSSPEPMFAEVGGAPAGFVGHNFAPASRSVPGPTVESHAEPFGSLNFGVAVFNDVAVVNRMATLCREWCGSTPERMPDGRVRFADQKYLEWLVDEFPGIVVVKNEAAMVGPWNIHARSLDVRDGAPHFGNRPIGFFHFSALTELPDGHATLSRPEYQISRRQEELLYRPYFAALAEARK